MAITGTLTIPEQVIPITDALGVVLSKINTNHAYFESGVSISSSFADAWSKLNAEQRTKVREGAYLWIWAISEACGENISIGGTF